MLRRFFSLAFGVGMLLATLSVCSGFAFTPTTLDFDAQEIVASEQVEPATSTSSNPSESTSSNAINLDGVLFETWVSEREWVIPPNQPDASTPIEFGLRITNNRQEPIRLALPLGMLPVLLGIDESLKTYYFSGTSGLILRESDYPVVMPGESIILTEEVEILWEDNRLLARGGDAYANQWWFHLEPNAMYLLRTWYVGSDCCSTGGVDVEQRTSPPNPTNLILLDETVERDTEPLLIVVDRIIGNQIVTPAIEISTIQH
jgi:hypothetical protein